MNQDLQPKRLMNEAVAIEQARELNKPSRSFEEKQITDKHVRDEMQWTMMNCSPCMRKDA